MITIKVKRNGNYTETTIEGFNGKVETGLCDDAEAENVCLELIDAVYEIAQNHGFDELKEAMIKPFELVNN